MSGDSYRTSKTIKRLSEKCSNVNCPNELGQGSFALAIIDGMALLLCMPCAHKLMQSVDRNNDDRNDAANCKEKAKG